LRAANAAALAPRARVVAAVTLISTKTRAVARRATVASACREGVLRSSPSKGVASSQWAGGTAARVVAAPVSVASSPEHGFGCLACEAAVCMRRTVAVV
jgi:hypothetical protein